MTRIKSSSRPENISMSMRNARRPMVKSTKRFSQWIQYFPLEWDTCCFMVIRTRSLYCFSDGRSLFSSSHTCLPGTYGGMQVETSKKSLLCPTQPMTFFSTTTRPYSSFPVWPSSPSVHSFCFSYTSSEAANPGAQFIACSILEMATCYGSRSYHGYHFAEETAPTAVGWVFHEALPAAAQVQGLDGSWIIHLEWLAYIRDTALQ